MGPPPSALPAVNAGERWPADGAAAGGRRLSGGGGQHGGRLGAFIACSTCPRFIQHRGAAHRQRQRRPSAQLGRHPAPPRPANAAAARDGVPDRPPGLDGRPAGSGLLGGRALCRARLQGQGEVPRALQFVCGQSCQAARMHLRPGASRVARHGQLGRRCQNGPDRSGSSQLRVPGGWDARRSAASSSEQRAGALPTPSAGPHPCHCWQGTPQVDSTTLQP